MKFSLSSILAGAFVAVSIPQAVQAEPVYQHYCWKVEGFDGKVPKTVIGRDGSILKPGPLIIRMITRFCSACDTPTKFPVKAYATFMPGDKDSDTTLDVQGCLANMLLSNEVEVSLLRPLRPESEAMGKAFCQEWFGKMLTGGFMRTDGTPMECGVYDMETKKAIFALQTRAKDPGFDAIDWSKE